MNYTLTEQEAKLTAKCLDEMILLWDRHNIKHNITFYEIINIIVKLTKSPFITVKKGIKPSYLIRKIYLNE